MKGVYYDNNLFNFRLRTIYANKILIGSESKIMAERFAMGALLGWILIPIAIIKMFL